jgi:hypothetical protein
MKKPHSGKGKSQRKADAGRDSASQAAVHEPDEPDDMDHDGDDVFVPCVQNHRSRQRSFR